MNSRLHTKLQLSSLKNKKVGKTAQNVHCAVCMCTRSAPKIVKNALVLLRNIIGIIKPHIQDNHIEFEVSGRFGGVWPTVRRPCPCPLSSSSGTLCTFHQIGELYVDAMLN